MLTGCPILGYGGNDSDVVLYAQNETHLTIYVRYSSAPDAAVVPAGEFGGAGLTAPGEPITIFDGQCHRIGSAKVPDVSGPYAILTLAADGTTVTVDELSTSSSLLDDQGSPFETTTKCWDA